MKRTFVTAIALTALALPLIAQDAKPTANPVTAVVKQQLERRSKIMLATSLSPVTYVPSASAKPQLSALTI